MDIGAILRARRHDAPRSGHRRGIAAPEPAVRKRRRPARADRPTETARNRDATPGPAARPSPMAQPPTPPPPAQRVTSDVPPGASSGAPLRPGLRLTERVQFPPNLPITARVIDIANAIDAQPGRHRRGRDRLGQDDAAAEDLPRDGPRRATRTIGCTQPRRIAATSVAARVAAGARHRARRRRRLQGPLQRQDQADARTSSS